ncbi:MAG: hypothetical protein KGS46_14160 [Chloroflexi bacterium]|nr:hypothetical protein [Chloroflexota bacterium]
MAKSRKLSDFRQQAMNANRHTERGMKALEASMNEVGYTAPMIAAADGEIIAGSARHETAANVFGADVEPVIVESDGKRPIVVVRTDIKNAETRAAKRIGLLDNRVQEIDLSFDPLVLAQLYAEDKTLTAGLWSDDELTELLNEAAGAAAGDVDAEPQIDKAAELNKVWQVKEGDLWQIGEHRLLCGDSTRREDVERVMMGEHFQTLIYDPEWNSAPKMDLPDCCIAFTDGQRAADVINYFGAPAWIFVWDCVSSWYTPNRPLKRGKLAFFYGDISKYNFDGAHYGDAGDARTVFNTRGSYEFVPDARGKHLSDVFSQPITKLHAESEHSHSKPLDWVKMLIANCTTGIVYDPFAGSGTTLVACQNLNRKCRAIELSPDYCAVILQRMKDAFPSIEIKRHE